MILDLARGKDFYGQNCAEPIIISENITIDTAAIQTIGTNKDTLKVEVNDFVYNIDADTLTVDITADEAQNYLANITERVRTGYDDLLSKRGEAISNAEENLRLL